LIGALLALVLVSSHRSPLVPREFEHQHPCPATGRGYGPCPGYIRDHIIPLCAGGPDAPENMQWQTLEQSKVKDRQERRQCAAIRRGWKGSLAPVGRH
jgi:hypothetical protein